MGSKVGSHASVTGNNQPAQAAPADALPAIDLPCASAFFDGDRALLLQFCGIFMEDCPRTLGEIGRAVRSLDAKELRLSAHKFVGAASQFAARESAAVARRLESMGRSGDLTGVDTVYSEFTTTICRLMGALDQLSRDLTQQLRPSESNAITWITTLLA